MEQEHQVVMQRLGELVQRLRPQQVVDFMYTCHGLLTLLPQYDDELKGDK